MHKRPVWFLSVAILGVAMLVCHGQEVMPTPSPVEAEVESVIVSATRFAIPLDQSPATVTVISSEDIAQKQIQRVSDALREVPGLAVVQTGTAGQLTSCADCQARTCKCWSTVFQLTRVYPAP